MRIQFGLLALALIAVVFGPMGFPSSASADFTICNNTATPASIAIGYKENNDWVSEGWWNIDPGDCAAVVTGDLKNQYYYIRGEAEDGHWADDYNFCYIEEVFTIYGDTDCAARGYKTGGFQEIDVGTALDFIINLTE